MRTIGEDVEVAEVLEVVEVPVSSHHSDDMSQGLQVSQSALWQCFSTMVKIVEVIELSGDS